MTAELISSYLCVGMHHMTPEGREAIEEIIHESQRFKVGDKVYKPSGKPFKSNFKINTIKGFVLNPYTKKVALTFEEDESNVEAFRCEVALTTQTLTYRS